MAVFLLTTVWNPSLSTEWRISMALAAISLGTVLCAPPADEAERPLDLVDEDGEDEDEEEVLEEAF